MSCMIIELIKLSFNVNASFGCFLFIFSFYLVWFGDVNEW